MPLSALTAPQERPIFSAMPRPPPRAVAASPRRDFAPPPQSVEAPPPLLLVGAVVGERLSLLSSCIGVSGSRVACFGIEADQELAGEHDTNDHFLLAGFEQSVAEFSKAFVVAGGGSGNEEKDRADAGAAAAGVTLAFALATVVGERGETDQLGDGLVGQRADFRHLGRTDQKVVRLRQGESLGGWSLTSVRPREVTFKQGKRSEVLALQRPDAAPPAGPPTDAGGRPAMPGPVDPAFSPSVPRSTPKNGEWDGL